MHISKRIGLVLPLAMVCVLVSPSIAAATETKTQLRAEKVAAKTDTAVTKRITSMQEVKDRVSSMKRLSDAQKQAIITELDADIAEVQALDAKMKNETDPTVRKADLSSLAKNTRIYALVIPQANITAAAERALTLADMLAVLSTKFQTRIGEAQSAGKDIAKMTASVAIMNTKIADAKVQAQFAIDTVANLAPDGGDAAKREANTAALKKARTALKTAEQDLKAAREASKSVFGAVKGVGASATAPVSAGATTSTAE